MLSDQSQLGKGSSASAPVNELTGEDLLLNFPTLSNAPQHKQAADKEYSLSFYLSFLPPHPPLSPFLAFFHSFGLFFNLTFMFSPSLSPVHVLLLSLSLSPSQIQAW